jgi:hypothetical protein
MIYMTLVRYKFLHSKSRKDKLKYAENTASMHTHGTRTPRVESPLSNQVTLAPKFRDDNRQPPLFCTPSPSLDHSVEWYRKTGTSVLRSIWCATLHADSSVASVRIKWEWLSHEFCCSCWKIVDRKLYVHWMSSFEVLRCLLAHQARD